MVENEEIFNFSHYLENLLLVLNFQFFAENYAVYFVTIVILGYTNPLFLHLKYHTTHGLIHLT